jgi:hypothetical protein
LLFLAFFSALLCWAEELWDYVVVVAVSLLIR